MQKNAAKYLILALLSVCIVLNPSLADDILQAGNSEAAKTESVEKESHVRISGIVKAGSVDNEVHIRINNNSEKTVTGIKARISKSPGFVSNFQIEPKEIDLIAPNNSVEFTVHFDVSENAPMGETHIVKFRLSTVMGKLEDTEPEMKLTVAGETDRVLPPGKGTDRTGPITPDTIDPASPEADRYIRDWMANAKPPLNAVPGANVRYSSKGNTVGTGPEGIIKSSHDEGKPIDPVFLWKNKRSLDSVDHCTMEEYVVAKFKKESIRHCQGRYGGVRDLTGEPLSTAKKVVESGGFKPSIVQGSPAKSPQAQETIEKQEPDWKKPLKKGETIMLVVHSPYVSPGVSVPDMRGMTLKQAMNALNSMDLKIKPSLLGAAPDASRSQKVNSQKPAAGEKVPPGSIVRVEVYGDYVSPGVTVPNMRGMTLKQAMNALNRVDLKIKPSLLGAAPDASRSQKVNSQEPAAGAEVKPGSIVQVEVYGDYYVTEVIPPTEEQPTNKDYCKCEINTSLLEGDSEFCGLYKESKNQFGEVDPHGRDLTYHIVNNALERSGSWKTPNGWYHSDFNTCSYFLENTSCEGFCPKDGEYITPGVTVPDMRGMTLKQALNALNRVDLKIRPSLLGAAPDASRSQKVNSQKPAAGAKVPPGSIVQVEVWGDFVAPGIGIPDVRGMTLADAKSTLQNIGLGIKPSLLGPAPTKTKALRINSQNPPPGTTSKPGTTVKVDLWGAYVAANTGISSNDQNDNKLPDLTGKWSNDQIVVTKEGNYYVGRLYLKDESEHDRKLGYWAGMVRFKVGITPVHVAGFSSPVYRGKRRLNHLKNHRFTDVIGEYKVYKSGADYVIWHFMWNGKMTTNAMHRSRKKQ